MYQARSHRQERARVAADLRAEGKTRVEVAEVFRRRFSVNARVALRWSRGWSQREAAEEWCKRWPDDIKLAKNVSYWETWPQSGHAPSLRTLDRLAQLYECDVADLVADLPGYRHLDSANSSSPASRTTTSPSTPATGPRAGAIAHDLLGAGWTSSVAPPIEATTPVDVMAIRAMSEAFQATDRRLGGGALYGHVVRYLNHELAPHLLASTGDDAESELFAAAASLTEAAGWMAHDGGDDHRARGHLTRAFKLATVAADPGLLGNVCASMSHLASHVGQASEAVRLAGMGLSHVEVALGSARLVARLNAMEALGLATQGNMYGCREALDRAEQALATCEVERGDWVSHFDEGSLASETATCLRRLHVFDQAEHHARRAIELRNGDRVRSRALAQVTLAHVLANSGRIDEAASIGITACQAARSLTSARVVGQLESLRLALAGHEKLTLVGDFLAALADTRPPKAPAADQPPPWPT
jgi:hypothetical protein